MDRIMLISHKQSLDLVFYHFDRSPYIGLNLNLFRNDFVVFTSHRPIYAQLTFELENLRRGDGESPKFTTAGERTDRTVPVVAEIIDIKLSSLLSFCDGLRHRSV